MLLFIKELGWFICINFENLLMYYPLRHRVMCQWPRKMCVVYEGSATEQMVSKISKSQDFIEISGFLWYFNIS